MHVVSVAAALAVCVAGAQQPPPQHERAFTTYDWCDCAEGLSSVKVWAAGASSSEEFKVAMGAGATAYLNFSVPTDTVEWLCDGMSQRQTSTAPNATAVWSLRATVEEKAIMHSSVGACVYAIGAIKKASSFPHYPPPSFYSCPLPREKSRGACE